MKGSKKKLEKHPRSVEFKHKTHLPAYSIYRHAREFNEPLSCKSGIHKKLVNRIINGVLHLYCTKCGGIIAQGIHDKTWTKQDIHKIKLMHRQQKGTRKTKRQMLEESREALELLRTKFTDKEIAKMMKRRRYGL